MTSRTNEASFGVSKKKIDYTADVQASMREFGLSPTVPIASELMFISNEAGAKDISLQAANFILKHSDSLQSKSVLRFANEVVGVDLDFKSQVENSSSNFLKAARKQLSIEYRNPVLLIDVARELTSAGHQKSALRYVRAAVGLAPDSRFIVRSAARYFLHVGDYDQAHDLLKRTSNIKTDPWLQASELAVASIRSRPSMLSKSVFRSLLDAKSVGPERSELASAVATMELKSGSTKNAKQLFNKALVSPNDNSLAQVEWAAERLKLIVDEQVLKTPLSFEANTNNAYRRMDIAQAIQHAKQWSEDEPFASRPFDALSYFYSLDDDYVSALDSTEKAMRVEGGEKLTLLLNKLFAKIQLGELDESYIELLKLTQHPDAKSHAVHLCADYGALAYATGSLDEGRTFYGKAVEIARKRGDRHSEGQALAYFARAAIAYDDPKSEEILERANKQVLELPSQGAIYVVSRLVTTEKRIALLEVAAARVKKRQWSWDAASNTLRQLE